MKKLLSGTFFILLILGNALSAQNLTLDGAKQYQTIHGLGVNINPQSWNVNPEAVRDVIDSLITGMGCIYQTSSLLWF